jgi:hypothetical protein
MGLHLATVADSIAGLTVSGVTIKDIDQIPPDVTRLTPILFPEPLNYVTNFSMSRDSTGTDTDARKTAVYDLNYTFCFSPVGSDRPLALYNEMVAKVVLIVNDILENSTITGCVDIELQNIPAFGPVPDPAGNMYDGCRLAFTVTDFLEIA